jgi:potassium-dependent mechanosensitive channel
VFIALGTIGIDLTAFAVFTGALGVGIGFGLQAIFNNFVAGLILLSEKSLKVGDFIDLERGISPARSARSTYPSGEGHGLLMFRLPRR